MPIETLNDHDASAYAQRLAAVLRQLRARRHELCTSLVDEYQTVLAEYRELPESVLIRDVTDAAVQNIRVPGPTLLRPGTGLHPRVHGLGRRRPGPAHRRAGDGAHR